MSELDKQLWGDFKEGYLTERGFRQVKQLGEAYGCHEKLVIEASTIQRVMLSTIAFITKACPNNYAIILKQFFEDYYYQYATNLEEYLEIVNSDFQNPMEFHYEHFIRPNDFLFHGHDSKVCPRQKQIEETILKSDRHLQIQAYYKAQPEFTEVLGLLRQSYPSKTITPESVTLKDIKTLYSNYQCNIAQGFTIPEPSDTALLYMKKIFAYQFYDVNNLLREQQVPAVSEIFKWIIQELRSDVQFSWYSGHDSNQVAILSVIGFDQLIPPFASQLEFDISNQNIDVYFNGVKIRTKFCKSGLWCTVEEAIEYLNSYIDDDLGSYCDIIQN